MSLNNIVTVNITSLTQALSQKGFGTPLLVSYFPTSRAGTIPLAFPERVRSYSSLKEMTADGFLATDAAYQMAEAVAQQKPMVTSWKVGRRAGAAQQTFTLTPTSTVEGEVLSFIIEGAEVSYTIPAAATVNSIATAMQSLVNAVTGVTAVDATGSVTITPTTANDLLSLGGFSSGLDIKDNTPDPTTTITTDLNAIEAEDADWYGFGIDSQSEAEITAASGWAESRGIIFAADNMDTENKTSATTDVGTALKALGYDRSIVLHSGYNQQYSSMGLLGRIFPKKPGSYTAAFQDIIGVEPSNLTTNEQNILGGKNLNFFHVVGGARVVQHGTAPSGKYIDLTIGGDWVTARIQERIFALLVREDKLPFTEATRGTLYGTIQAVLVEAASMGILAPNTADTPHTIDVPSAASLPTADRANRLWSNITFSANFAGAAQKFVLDGTISV